MTTYYSNFGHCAFGVPLGGSWDNVGCSFWAYWKASSGLPISVIELFSLGFTAEALRAKIDRKSAISPQRGHFDSKFQVEEIAHYQSFWHGFLGQ